MWVQVIAKPEWLCGQAGDDILSSSPPHPPIPCAAQARAAPEVSVFGARRLPTPAAQGPLNLLRA